MSFFMQYIPPGLHSSPNRKYCNSSHIFFFKELHEAVNIEACFISFLKEAMAHYTHYSEIFLLFQYILDISPYKYMRRCIVLHCRDLS